MKEKLYEYRVVPVCDRYTIGLFKHGQWFETVEIKFFEEKEKQIVEKIVMELNKALIIGL